MQNASVEIQNCKMREMQEQNKRVVACMSVLQYRTVD